PRLSLPTLALRTRVPVAVVVFEHRSTALRADHLRDRTECHDQLSKTAAIDVRHVLEVQQNFRVSLRHFVTNSLSERSQRVACRDSSGKINDEYGVRSSRSSFESHIRSCLEGSREDILTLLRRLSIACLTLLRHPVKDSF